MGQRARPNSAGAIAKKSPAAFDTKQIRKVHSSLPRQEFVKIEQDPADGNPGSGFRSIRSCRANLRRANREEQFGRFRVFAQDGLLCFQIAQETLGFACVGLASEGQVISASEPFLKSAGTFLQYSLCQALRGLEEYGIIQEIQRLQRRIRTSPAAGGSCRVRRIEVGQQRVRRGALKEDIQPTAVTGSTRALLPFHPVVVSKPQFPNRFRLKRPDTFSANFMT